MTSLSPVASTTRKKAACGLTFVRHGAKNARNSLSRTIVAASVGVFYFFPPSLVARSERPERMESETRERLEKEHAWRLGPCREGQCDNTYHALKGTWNMPMLRNAEVRSKNAIGKRKLWGTKSRGREGKTESFERGRARGQSCQKWFVDEKKMGKSLGTERGALQSSGKRNQGLQSRMLDRPFSVLFLGGLSRGERLGEEKKLPTVLFHFQP